MNTIRFQLTVRFAGALLITMFAFALAVWEARRSGAAEEVRRTARAEAEIVLAVLRQTEASGQPVTIVRDPAVGPVLTTDLRSLVEGMPDYVAVLAQDGRLLALSSAAVSNLSSDDSRMLDSTALAAPAGGSARLITLGEQPMLLVIRQPPATRSAVSRIAVAIPIQPVQQEAVRELIGTLVVIAPLLLLVSLALGYAIAGRAIQPVDKIINEVHAITDGRSLHRRLAAIEGAEMQRLVSTLNEMLERLESSFAALRRFTADASHELKTPLAVLRADVERAMTESAPRADRLVALEEALHEITRMADLVESLLTLARADEGRFDLHREPVDLAVIVRDVFETAAILGEERRADRHAAAPRAGRRVRRQHAAAPPLPEPRDERDQVHATRGQRGAHARSATSARWRSTCATRGSASPRAIYRTSSSGSTGRTARAPACPSAAASASAWPSRSTSRRRTAGRSRCDRGSRGEVPSRSRCRSTSRRRRYWRPKRPDGRLSAGGCRFNSLTADCRLAAVASTA